MTVPGAFEGIRVIELAQWVFVPVAGALLADWGADVIRIERLDGDPYRGLATQGIGTDSGGVNLSMALANRGKRSVALDLRKPRWPGGAARPARHRGCSADQPAARVRSNGLGLGADAVRERYPTLIYARGHGFGVRGPDADQPGYDSFRVLGPWRGRPHPHPGGPGLPDQPARRDGRPQRRDGAGVRDRRPRCSSARAPARGRWSTCRCSPRRCGRCPRTCWRRSTVVWSTAPSGRTALCEPARRPPTARRTVATFS